MRIDRLGIENFKKFDRQSFELHPHFTLLVGENGSGKTSVLDALAVAMAIWLVRPPDSEVQNSKRHLLKSEIRLVPSLAGDRVQFREVPPASVTAVGSLAGHDGITWIRQNRGGDQTNDSGAKQALEIIASVYERDGQGEKLLCPVLAYYGAGRAWLPSNKRWTVTRPKGLARRWAAFYDCFKERIRFAELQKWFSSEAAERGNRAGRWRPGFQVVRRAILRCVPGADDVWFDTDLDQIVLSIAGNAQPFDNLSAGQRMMLALAADLGIKAVTQNNYLVPPDELGPEDEPWPKVLRETPGVVLIDELDVHLHPTWQRRVATDLKTTFPAIQFVCTSHSPQVIGEVTRDEVRLLRPDGAEHRVERPSVALGADSNWILDHVMDGAASKSLETRTLQDAAEDALAEGSLAVARAKLAHLRALLDGDTGELVRLESSLGSLEALAKEASKGSAPSEND